DGEQLRFDHLADAKHVARVVDALFGAHIADVNHAFDALGDLNKRAKLRQVRHRAFDHRAHGKFAYHVSPGVAERLLQAKRDAAFVGIDLQNLGFHFLARGEDIGGLVDAAPADVADVEQRVHSTNVDEGAIARKTAHSAMHGVAFANFGVAAVLEGAFFFFRK